jgi:hypothetical protein
MMAAAADNGVIIGAVAKTCSLLADSGDSLISAVEGIGKGEGFIVAAEGNPNRERKSGQARLRIPPFAELRTIGPNRKSDNSPIAQSAATDLRRSDFGVNQKR